MEHALTAEPSAGLAQRTLARVRGLGRASLYAAATRSMMRVALPTLEHAPRTFSNAIVEASKLHERVLSRPGMREIYRRAELLEDLATFPAFAATIPFDMLRALRKVRSRTERIDVRPDDDFPYPDYYLNDFHHQYNGNLSLRAALTYEWQIKFLFLGTNRLMRQGVIDEVPPGDDLDVLDVATGTAAWVTLARLQDRRHKITGIDLSPHYLKLARLLRGRDAMFLQMNAEQMAPEWTDRFDLVTCIWLFHELPPEAAERATAEMARVLKPGGKLVFMDAAQSTDVPEYEIEASNDNFRNFFNEPYFAVYQRLDLPALFARHGLALEKTERWYASKVMTLRKTP